LTKVMLNILLKDLRNIGEKGYAPIELL